MVRTVPDLDLSSIEAAFRRRWSVETCDTVDVHLWHAGNPSRGQCGVTALVLQEILGGELLVADVLFADGEPQGVHYWNRLSDGQEVDFTREQFCEDDVVIQPPRVAARTRRTPGRLVERYELLRSAVLADLDLDESQLRLIWPT